MDHICSRFLCIFVVLTVSSAPLFGQAGPDPLWLRQFWSGASETPRAAASDADGVFVVGGTGGSLGGPHLGSNDVFLVRYDRMGQQQWIRQFGTPTNDTPYAADADGAGGVFIGGYMEQGYGWIARFDHKGEQLWFKQPWSVPGTHVNGIAADGKGGAFTAGRTDGSIAGPSAGLSDVTVARFAGDGQLLWVRQFGTVENDGASAAASDGAGGVFVGGYTSGHLVRPVVGLQDAILARYTAQGDRLWLRQFGDTPADRVTALAPDDTGGVFAAGPLSIATGSVRLSRWNAAGEELWAIEVAALSGGVFGHIVADGSGGVYVVGSTMGSLGGPNQGSSDAYIARYDRDGNRIWISQIGTPQTEYAYAVASDFAGGAYLVGRTNGGDFLGNYPKPPASVGNVFLVRFPGEYAPTGACCLHSGSCIVVTAFRCEVDRGSYRGDFSDCSRSPCPQPGACCFPSGNCNIRSEIQCADQGGIYRGHSTSCQHANCPLPTGERTTLPAGYASSSGNSSGLAILLDVPLTFQTVYAASHIDIPVGARITGVSVRTASRVPGQPWEDILSTWPAHPVQFETYQLQLSTSLNPPGMLSPVFADNIGPDVITVRNGPIVVPSLSQPGGAIQPALNPWGHDIEFTNPFIYTGGDLLVTIRHGGNASNTRRAYDGLPAPQPGPNAVAQALFAWGENAATGNLASLHILRISYTTEPECYPNCDHSTTHPILNIEDFTCFINEFAAALALPPAQQISHYANCDHSTTPPVLNVDDFTCFINAFAKGCP